MRHRALAALGLLAALALGYQVRALTRESVFRDGRVYFYGTDAWYHMRRIEHALAGGFRPRLADFPTPDPYLSYPDGGEGYWGPLFDLSMAAGLAAFGVETRADREAVAATVPAVLGALCTAAAFLLGRAILGAGLGVAAALLLAVLPGHVIYSQLGHLDHHVLESLLFGLLLYAFYRLMHRPDRGALVASVVLTAALFLVTPFTSLAHAAVLIVFALAEVRWCGGDGRGVTRSLIASAILLAPVGLYWSATDSAVRAWTGLPVFLLFERYSLLQPLLLLLGAAAIAAVGGSRRGVMATAGLAALCAWPVASGLFVLAKGDPDIAFTSETQSILFVPGADGASLGPAVELFGFLFPFVPLAAGYLFYRAPRERGLWVLTLVLFGLVLVQLRFVYTFAFAMALLLARLPALLRRRRWLGGLGVALALFPCASWIDAVAQQQHYQSISKETYDALEWMRGSTPPTDRDAPEYAVLASWDLGHAVVYIAERPVVADPFNHGFEPMARFFTATDPSEARSILERHRVRYVIPTNLSHAYLRRMYLAYARRPPGFVTSEATEGRGPLELERVYRSPDRSVVILEAPRAPR